MFIELVHQMKKQLGQMDKWLETASTHAKAKSFDPTVFVGLRLAPDQLPFAKQVQIACDTAKLSVSRLTGKEAPVHADTEVSLEELSTRVKSVVAYLDGFSAKDFEGSATREVTQPRWKGSVMSGADYFIEHAVPNFFFHLAHAYAILRHNGVSLGKKDYLGELSMRQP